VPVVELLLTAGADINATDEVCWHSTLCRAILMMDVAFSSDELLLCERWGDVTSLD
jgi:hypothetical protein